MKQFENPNEVIVKIVKLGDHEHGLAVYTHNKCSMNEDNFRKYESEDAQENYKLWSGGELEAMTNIREIE